jgi:hypothetical protein
MLSLLSINLSIAYGIVNLANEKTTFDKAKDKPLLGAG